METEARLWKILPAVRYVVKCPIQMGVFSRQQYIWWWNLHSYKRALIFSFDDYFFFEEFIRILVSLRHEPIAVLQNWVHQCVKSRALCIPVYHRIIWTYQEKIQGLYDMKYWYWRRCYQTRNILGCHHNKVANECHQFTEYLSLVYYTIKSSQIWQ